MVFNWFQICLETGFLNKAKDKPEKRWKNLKKVVDKENKL